MSILLDALDITNLSSNGLRFEFRSGHPTEIPEWVGADDDVPGASGMDPGQWRKRSRMVRLYGCVIGAGSDADAQQVSFRSRMNALIAEMDVNSTLTITVTNEFGLGSATLTNVRPQRIVTEREFADLIWIGTLELVCIDSPPEWVIGS